MHILNILESLKAETGTGSKERKMMILDRYKDHKMLKAFFFWTLDPQFNYWQSKITKDSQRVHKDELTFLDAMAMVMANLANRKVTGNKAKTLLTDIYYQCGYQDAELLQRVILGKPDVGFSVGTVNEVWKDLIYDPAYMRCKSYSPKLVSTWDWENDIIISELKADGMFVNLILDGMTHMETRSGEQLDQVVETFGPSIITALDIIRMNMKDVPRPVIHGELVCYQDGVLMERSKSNGLINKVKLGGKFPKGVNLTIQVWDYIPAENFYLHLPYEVTYDVRFEKLERILNGLTWDAVEVIEHRYVKSPMKAQEHFIECLQRGLEGTVLKNASKLIWKNHDSPNQLKLKNKFRFEMRVIGFTEGEGKYASTFGSMIIESECGLLKSAISGMTDKIRNYINANRSIFMDSVVECEANGLFKNDDGSYGLMHPRYKELRLDRTKADTLERIIQQEKDSILGKEIETGEI